MKYIEEYIPKLHIHQHSLLTRKVFFRRNFQHWSSSLYHWIMFIFKSSSASSHLDLDHLSIWIIIQRHHWIQIITRSRSISLDWIWIITRFGSSPCTGSGSSLDLDHHCWIWIITRSGSLGVIITGSGSQLDLDLHWSSSSVYYLVIESSTEPSLFHAGCRPTLMQVFAQHLHMIMQ